MTTNTLKNARALYDASARRETILKLVHEITMLKAYLNYEDNAFIKRCLSKRNMLLSAILKHEISY